MNIVKKNINDLKFHSMNEQIYGSDENISELKEEILKSGIVTTFTINLDNVVISGNRRLKACRELVEDGYKQFTEVECEIKDFLTPEDELAYLIICNKTRIKTQEQIAREAIKLLEVEKILAEKRKQSMLKQNQTTDIPTLGQRKKGKSSEMVADQIGVKSGHEIDRMVVAVKKIDELTEQGRLDDAQLIRNELNNGTVSAAEKLAKHIDELSNEDKQDIIRGKVSVNKATNKTVKSATKKMKSKPAAVVNDETVDNTAADTVDSAVDNTIKYPKTFDDPEGLGLVTPEKVDKYFGLPIDGALDVNAVLHADPRKLEDFMETLKYINNWASYTMDYNKANLITFTNKAIENAKIDGNEGNEYVELSMLINCMQTMIDTIKPIIDDYEKETRDKNREQMERRASQDEEAKQKMLEEKERVRRESMEKSRKFSQNMQEIEYKKTLKQDNLDGEDW